MKGLFLKIRKSIDKLLTFQFDKQKHLNGAIIVNWLIVMAYMFGGKTAAIVVIITGLLTAVVWEFGTSKFSFLDIMAFVVGITPISVLILN